MERPGARPATSAEIPHEQLDQTPSLTIQAELWRRMIALPGITVGPSKKSVPQTRALHLDPALARGPREAFIDGTEFAHLHGNHDGSLHASLPLDVAGSAVAQGWAEVHPLVHMGRRPPNLVMLYAPRDEHDLEIIWQLVEQSYAFARTPAA
jgi:phospholipase/carboxylesterase